MKLLSHQIFRIWILGILAMLLSAAAFGQSGSYGSFSGGIFNDANDNGVRDLGESGIPNIEVLVMGPSGVGRVTTNAQGRWAPNEFLAGPYQVIPPLAIGGATLSVGSAAGIVNVDLAPGGQTPLDLPYHETCMKISAPKILWTVGSNGLPNGGATVSFTITNNNTWPVGWIFVTPQSGTYTGPNPIQLNPPLAPGGSQVITLPMTGLQPNSTICFNFDFHSPNLEFCCSDRICFKVPECDCYQVIEEEILCLPNGTFQMSLTLQNLTPYNINKIWTLGTGGMTATPIVHNVSLAPGGIVTLNVNLSGTNIGGTTQCLKIMFYDGGIQCCVKDYCFELPKCDNCDERPPICYALRPTYNVGANPGQENYNGPDWAAFSGKTVAAVTCYAANTNDLPNTAMPDNVVFGYQNLDQYQCLPGTFGTNFSPTPLGFHNGLDGPMAPFVPEWAKWTKKYMGNVFAITFDNLGNAYVAQTSCYNADYAPLIQDFNLPSVPGRNHVASPNELGDRRLHGRIFKIENGTGKVTIFNEDTTTQWNGLPSANDPLINSLGNQSPGSRPEIEFSSQGFPEVGDVTFDYDHNQIFATSMDDGKIYRFSMSGQKLSSFDPFGADTGPTYGNGFAPLDENIWAAKYHRGRVYFSRWREDFDTFSATTFNEVWSVEISNTAPFNFVGTARLEVKTPDLIGNPYALNTKTASAPISDITFTKEGPAPGMGHMVVAERGMGGNFLNGGGVYEQLDTHATPVNPSIPQDAFTNTYPHRSRLLKFSCNPDTLKWEHVPGPTASSNFFDVGGALGSAGGTNSGGGTDFDFDNRNCTGPGLGNRVWVMADYMPISGGQLAYGLQGLPLTGGNLATSVVQDLDGNIVWFGGAKTTNGDVEIPCPTQNGTAGRVSLNHFVQSPSGRAISARFIGNGINIVAQSQIQTNGEVTFQADVPNGTYEVYLETLGHLLKRVTTTVSGGVSTFGVAELVPGDADCDNEVGPGDFEIVVSAFGSSIGSSGYVFAADFDWNGEIGPSDFECLLENFSRIGDQP